MHVIMLGGNNMGIAPQDCNGVEPSVLGKYRQDDLEHVGIGLEAVRLHASQGLCIL